MDSKIKYLDSLRRKGYTENFAPAATSSPNILTDKKRSYKPGEIKIASFNTFSSDTDPNDFSVMYAIETIDGKKGVLVDEHCESPDAKVESFINSIKLAKQNNKKYWFMHPWQSMFKVKFSMNI